MTETKKYVLAEDQLEAAEVVLGVFEDDDAAQKWISDNAPDETYTGPDVDGKQVTVEGVDWWPGYTAKVEGTDDEVSVTVVTGYLPEENSGEEDDDDES